jgi:signal peptidase I
MTPTMDNGDLAVVEKQSSYHVGDIIAYRVPPGEPGAGSNVIHRIVGGTGATGFITKGDHNSYTDYFWHPKIANVIGRVWFHVPQAAAWLSKLRDPLTLALVVGFVSFVILAWPGEKWRERAEPTRPP